MVRYGTEADRAGAGTDRNSRGTHLPHSLHRLSERSEQLRHAGGVGGRHAEVQRRGPLERVQVPALGGEDVVDLVDVEPLLGRAPGHHHRHRVGA
jgi:hypothetical protein